MSEEKAIEMFVPYESRDKAKNLKCRWDSLRKYWYIHKEDINNKHIEDYKEFSVYALVDNHVSNDIKKEFNCILQESLYL